MTPAELVRLRLGNQLLERSTAHDPAGVVARLTAMQAQDYEAALWAVGVRLPNSTRDDIEAGIATGAVVRSWPMRGTLHAMAAADVRWLLRLTAPRAFGSARSRWRRLELSDTDFARACEILTTALDGGHALTRREIYALLAEHGVAPDGQRGIHVLNRLAIEGLLCVGPRRGKDPTFVLLDDWVPPQPLDDLGRDDALAELARRYLRGHGPATEHDLAWWSGLGLTDVRRALEAVRHEHDRAELDGVTHWFGRDVEVPPPSTRVLLVPAFDEIFLGYRDRTRCVPLVHQERVVPGGNGVFLPVVVHHGRGVATWRRHVTPAGVRVDVVPFPGAAVPDVAAAARRYARFLGLPTVPA